MFQQILYVLGESTWIVRVCGDMQNPNWYNNHVHGFCNIAVQSCYFIIPWLQHVLSCMNIAVDLSWWFQQLCPSLFVHQAMNSLFQHAWTSLSKTSSAFLRVKTHANIKNFSSFRNFHVKTIEGELHPKIIFFLFN